MNIQPLINAIRYKLRYGITVEWYNFWYMALRCHQKITPQVASIDETIRIIIEDQCSVSRFGDGEMLLTNPGQGNRIPKRKCTLGSASQGSIDKP